MVEQYLASADSGSLDDDIEAPEIELTYPEAVVDKCFESLLGEGDLLVLEVTEKETRYRSISRRELLQECQASWAGTQIDSALGTNLLPLQLRDIRLLNTYRSTSVIAVRLGAILMAIDEVRMIVLPGKCFLMVQDGADSSLYVFIQKADQWITSASANRSSFELKMLEAGLVTVLAKFGLEIQRLEANANSLLSAIRKSGTQKQLERLRLLKIDLHDALVWVESARRVLDGLTHNDEDMSLMRLSEIKNNPDVLQDPNFRKGHAEIEVLLEHYLLEVDDILGRFHRIETDITHTEHLVEWRLDNLRNRLHLLEVTFSMTAVILAMGNIIVGIFGMNLNNRQEDSYSTFLSVVITITAFTIFALFAFRFFLRSRGYTKIG
eukprot:TRINITY_DN18495_c0_g1::TRINITY_DN18495_c0_g1_i1::g.2822::m.2822 TRINITY_DN18495_c0_g1::TRINITY_DN18495_c0_g1_i1::g.2822  ORF type:complete len:380 (+),score=63.29,sp/Q6C8H7/LPE10_YARLI/29.53/1e-20,CorA/PF01544.13/0.24,NfeD/PF01957.13/0.2 TRINITY_DN18495_c0_g1_i1:112-1251(+)